MLPTVVGIDFDDVLVHSSSRVRHYLEDCFPDEQIQKFRPEFDYASFFIKPKSTLIKKDFLTEIVWNGEKHGLSPCFTSTGLWINATAISFILRLKRSRSKFEFVIATKRQDSGLVEEFLAINKIDHLFSKVYAGCYKPELPIDILVDDYPVEFLQIAEDSIKTLVIVPRMSYNSVFEGFKSFVYVDMDRVYNKIIDYGKKTLKES